MIGNNFLPVLFKHETPIAAKISSALKNSQIIEDCEIKSIENRVIAAHES